MPRLSLAVAICCACLTAYAQSSPRDVLLTAQQRAACKAKGGNPVHVRFYLESCVWPTTDAGKACRNTSACQGICEAPFGTARGKRVEGTCSAQAADIRGGCVNEVVAGRSTGDFCAE
jgi:hypothetical protein